AVHLWPVGRVPAMVALTLGGGDGAVLVLVGRFVRAGGEGAPPDAVQTGRARAKYIAPIKIQRGASDALDERQV
ncbi:MAG TPA: hypothetical protein VJ761_20380, partial [Ktedonobacteraceae bacterium]|nr:hypothetical protein [Ktedonobacteraceae bacterium]